jgi:UDP-N-acetylglucosamine 2-epimerase (non-hydrolysing)
VDQERGGDVNGPTLDVISVAGARPNFMKIAPLSWALRDLPGVRHRIVHTGQHYDRNMSEVFFEDLDIERPWKNLNVGSHGHARQTAEIMTAFDPILEEARPSVVVVVGDVNSTIACALTAVKRGIPVAHVEAGLRSFDRTMPEEVNRVLTDAIADTLFVTERAGEENLRREGVDPARIFLTGNVMIDTLLRLRDRARRSDVLARLRLEPRAFAVLTLHRPSNVDKPESLRGILAALEDVARECPIVFPVHPRTRSRLADAGMLERGLQAFRLCEPLSYLDFLALMDASRLLLTDSGGIQEEACVLKVPCLTLRENTERPVTVEVGINRLVGADPERIRAEALRIVRAGGVEASIPPLWDGRAAERIVAVLARRYGRQAAEGVGFAGRAGRGSA